MLQRRRLRSLVPVLSFFGALGFFAAGAITYRRALTRRDARLADELARRAAEEENDLLRAENEGMTAIATVEGETVEETWESPIAAPH